MKVKIDRLDHFGRGLTYVNDKVTFVTNALKDEIVEIEIIKELKNYNLAKVVNYIEKSPNRIIEKCPFANICGGCDLQHLNYEEENIFKKQKVIELMKRFANIDSSIINDTVCSNEYNYRNKVTLHSKNNVLGYYKKNSNNLVPINNCKLLDNRINELIVELNKDNSIEEAIIRTSNDSSEIMLKIKGNINTFSKLKDLVDVLIINDKVVTNKNSIKSRIGNKVYNISIDSFFQVNKFLTKKLYDEVLKNAKEIKPKTVLDLYCGTGTIGIYISDYVNNVIGVDSEKSSIINAKENKLLNKAKNIKFINSKVEDIIDSFSDIDLIIVDPPRSGLDNKTINNLLRINPKDIIYVSCDPSTLARDLNILKNNYNIKSITPFNMFPRTFHVESVVILERK